MAIDRTKLLPPGQPGTPEGTVVNPGVPAGYVSEKQYNGLNKNILAIRSNLKAIADLLVRRDSQEAAEDKADEKQLRRERQETRIQDVESNLGTKIKAALIKPIEVMKAKVQGPFEKIMNALKALFMGFVGMKAIDALKAWAEGDTETLEKLKNDLIQALAVGAGIFVALNGGIGLILGAAGALAGTILGALPAIFGLIVNPYVWLGALVALGGLALSDYVVSLTSGFSSYTPQRQEIIRRMATIGPEATIKELENLHAEHIRQYGPGPLNDWNGERAQMRQEIQRIKRGMAGDPQNDSYYQYMGRNISDDDKAIFNNMLAAMSKIDGYRELYDVTKLAAENTTDAAEKQKLEDKLKKLRDQMRSTQDFVKTQFSSLSDKGRETYSFVMGEDQDAFKRNMDPGFAGLGLGEFPDIQAPQINRIQNKLQILKSGQDRLLQPLPIEPQQSNNPTTNLKVSMNNTQTILKDMNFAKAYALDSPIDYSPEINILPFQTEPDAEPLIPDINTTIQDMNIPTIYTADNTNFYRDFASAMYES